MVCSGRRGRTGAARGGRKEGRMGNDREWLWEGQDPAGAEHTPGCVRRVGFARGIFFYSSLAKQISSAVNVSSLFSTVILAEFVVLLVFFFPFN